MAVGTRPRHAVDLDLDPDFDSDHDDDNGHTDSEEQQLIPASLLASNSQYPVLGELPLCNIQNITKTGGACAVEALAISLDNFHIHSSAKENISEQQHQQQTIKPRGRTARHHITKGSWQAPLAAPSEDLLSFSEDGTRTSSGASANMAANQAEDFQEKNALAVESQHLPSTQEQLLKHQAGQFEWVLSVPAAAGGDSTTACCKSLGRSRENTGRHSHGAKRMYFGCNLVHRRTQSGGAVVGREGKSANIYTILATRIECVEEQQQQQSTAIVDAPTIIEEETESVSGTHVLDADTTIIRMSEPSQAEEPSARRMSDATFSVKDDDFVGQVGEAVSPAHAHPTGRHDDVHALQGLDKLEEESEGLSEIAVPYPVLSSESPPPAPESPMQDLAEATAKTDPSKRTSKLVRKPVSSTTARTTTASERRSSLVRKSMSISSSKDEDKPPTATKSTTTPGPRKSIVPRPSSLLPPKAPVRSSKPPTVSTFELPGEAVARRLKEKREARRSLQVSSEQAASIKEAFSPSKPHVKSTKPPTRPAFELPGEAISRRKREEREARLRAQEEEERKRREFKARPIGAGVITAVRSSYPRETVASKARQSRVEAAAAAAAAAAANEAAATPVVRKRHSIAVTTMTSRPSMASSTSTLLSRGRAVDAGGSSSSRAPSSSMGSNHGGGSMVSKRSSTTAGAEDLLQQKARAREILARDSRFVNDRERERREREAAAKQARQEAADRSRQLSREWAEKQRVRKAVAAAAAAAGGGAIAVGK
ncbi:hypothetical protein B0T17DRAFT_23449 [Bombardia bombarda]|uniref:TPX2 C-terminal domain-containing protein n=1 Tax=Bombardia bombarda TaxID=252184 RepID=A0AA40CEZ2_9PEZI|nr:hypothetical protein B0T17DRAFT_23449 [Bombardia bombarda]